MPKFKYLARDKYGVRRTGVVVADTATDVENQLMSEGFQDIKVKLLDSAEKKKKQLQLNLELSLFQKKVKEKDLAIFTRQLGALISAGVGITTALDILAQQMPNKTLAKALQQVSEDVKAGMSLSAAMAKHKKVFPEFLVNLIAAAEESGNLDVILERATKYYEKIAAIKRKLISASWYPTAVLIIASLIVFGILTFIVPIFAKMYEGFGAKLPVITQLLIDFSNALRHNLLYIIIFIFGIIGINKALYSVRRFRKIYHYIMLKIPLIGGILKKGSLAKFARTLATLTSGGVPIIRALEISSTVAGNLVIEDAILRAKEKVAQGKSLHESLDEKVFPLMFISMVKVGEETGRLDEMLDTIAEFYEDEVDRDVEGLLSTIEPLLMVFIGGIVGIIIIALYLPIFKMGELISK